MLVLLCHSLQIKLAIKKLYNVDAARVNTLIR